MPSSDYAELLLSFQPRPIHSDKALQRAYKLIDSLMSRPRQTKAESEILEMLSLLVEQYESREHPTPDVSPAEMLEHLMDARGVTKAALAREADIPRSTITEILTGQRGISKANIDKRSRFSHTSRIGEDDLVPDNQCSPPMSPNPCLQLEAAAAYVGPYCDGEYSVRDRNERNRSMSFASEISFSELKSFLNSQPRNHELSAANPKTSMRIFFPGIPTSANVEKPVAIIA